MENKQTKASKQAKTIGATVSVPVVSKLLMSDVIILP